MKHLTRRSALLGLGVAAVSTGLGATAATAAPASSLSLTPAAGQAGSTVTVAGTGFPKAAAGTITGGDATVTFQTTKSGAFSAQSTIPATAQGQATLTVTVGRSMMTAGFTVLGGIPPVSTAFLRFGVATPGGAAAGAELDAIAALAGENPAMVLSYKDFRQAPPVAELEAVVNRGAMPMVTWEPWIAGNGVTQPAYTLDRIAAGDFDSYISEWGAALAAWGKPMMLRFAHEMNGNWYPWCEAVNGNQPGDYVRAWQHVHRLVIGAGAANVSWVWAPNGGGSVDPALLYPGDATVNTVGLDAYNWGTTQTWSSWQMPESLFGPHLAQLRTIAPGKQIIITETACAEAGGSKPDWNAALVSYLKAQPDVSGFVWFNFLKETDWRINSSAASASALAGALAGRR